MHAELLELEARLRGQGLTEEADEVHDLVDEAEAIERPASWLQRMRGRVGEVARRQWSHVRQEVEETRELYTLLRGRARGEIAELDPIQREKIRAQLLDLFKVVPGGALAVANFVAPIPMTSWLTPSLLMSLGLMPSAWKEAHLTHRLGLLTRRLRERGLLDDAAVVQNIVDVLAEDAAHRERMAAIAGDRKLLALFDRDRNGTLDADEQARMHAALDRVVATMRRRWGARIWYVFHDEDVCGPFALPELRSLPRREDTLLCRAGTRQWVPLAWVLREIEGVDDARQ